MIKECQMGKLPTLGQLIGFYTCYVGHFLTQCTSCTLVSFQSLKSLLLPKVHGDSLQMGAVLVWIYPGDLLPSFACVP